MSVAEAAVVHRTVLFKLTGHRRDPTQRAR